MTTRDRITNLLLCLLAPCVLAVALSTTTEVAVRFSGNDRAIVWAEGSTQALDRAGMELTNSGLFTDGRISDPDVRNSPPNTCSTKSRQLSVGGLHTEQAQAAREFIELLVVEAGATICSTNHFSLNELPDPNPRNVLTTASVSALHSGLVPLGFVACCYWAFAGQFKLPPMNPLGLTTKQILAFAMPAALSGTLFLLIIGLFSGPLERSSPLTLDGTGYALAFGILIASPLMEELAFRSWLITFSERAVGPVGALMLSSLAYATLSAPFGPIDFVSAALLGAVYAALYLRTRSVLACLMANSLVSATAFVPWPGA